MKLVKYDVEEGEVYRICKKCKHECHCDRECSSHLNINVTRCECDKCECEEAK